MSSVAQVFSRKGIVFETYGSCDTRSASASSKDTLSWERNVLCYGGKGEAVDEQDSNTRLPTRRLILQQSNRIDKKGQHCAKKQRARLSEAHGKRNRGQIPL